ncbi:MAG: hypothetical protein Tsb0013_16690 [Phycisphaerales bacterium]
MSALRTPRRRLLSTLALSACALLASVGVARADDPDDWSLGFGGGWFGGMVEMYQGPNLELATTQLERIADVLRLDDAQRDEMMSLFAALEDEHLRAWVRFAERNGDLQGKGMTGKEDWQEIQQQQRAISDDFKKEQERLINLMLTDLQLIITGEQMERWDTIERERLRMDTLTKYGCFPAERYDVAEAVMTLDLDDPARFDELIERYAQQMDPLLRARNRAIERAAQAFTEYNEKQQEMWGGFDWENPDAQAQYVALQEEVNALQRSAVAAALDAKPACERVAELNRRFAQEAADMLDGRDRRELEDLVDESKLAQPGGFNFQNYSRARQKFKAVLNMENMIGVYETWADSMGGDEEWGIMRLARQMEPLTPKQVSDIEALQEEFETEMEILETRRPGGEQRTEDIMKWSFTLRTPEGDMTLTHNDPPEEFSGAKGGFAVAGAFMMTGQDGSEEMEAYQRDKSQLEQRYIERLRELLTLRQRALIALQ